MRSEAFDFHEVHGPNIRLSDDRTRARGTPGTFGRLCFTRHPLQPGVKVLVTSDKDHMGFVFVGLTEKDPNTLKGKVPAHLGLGSRCKATGIRGSSETLDSPGGQFVIYLDGETKKVMISKKNDPAKELIENFRAEEPVYVVFDLRGEKKSLKLSDGSKIKPSVKEPELPFYPIKTKHFGNFKIEPAHFAPHTPSSVKMRANLALCHQPSTSGSNPALVGTFLRRDCVLIAQVTALKQTANVQIIFTVEDAGKVYSAVSLNELCDSTYSLAIESELGLGDEIAIKISRGGMVYTSRNNRNWTAQIHVDPDLEYHVVFNMTHVAILSLIGISNDISEVDVDVEEEPAEPSRSVVRNPKYSPELPICAICMENPRNVTLIPCLHVAICSECTESLKAGGDFRCPICRSQINDVQRFIVS